MKDLVLYTKNNCPACDKVKSFMNESNGEMIKSIKILNVNESENPAADIAYIRQYSQTFPTLVSNDFFITHSDKIIEFLKTLK